MRSCLIFVISLLLIAAANTVRAAPGEDPSAVKLYLPIESDSLLRSVQNFQQALNSAGLDDIQVVAAEYWQNYQRALRYGHSGIYLAAPHFTAWALAEHDFTPIVRLAEPLKYVIATHRSSPDIFEINDLDKRRVCAQKPLNLDYLLVNNAFDKPMLSADIISVRSVREEMLATDSPCAGFAVSNHVFDELAGLQRGKFIRLQQSKVYSNYALIAHPDIPAPLLKKLRGALGEGRLRQALEPVFKQFAKRTGLVAAHRDDYPSHYRQPLVNYWHN